MQRLATQWFLLSLLALAALRTLTHPVMQKTVFVVLAMFALLCYTDYRRRAQEALEHGNESRE